jgi:hypothetical protein
VTVTTVLDTSTLLAYTKGSLAVGELLSIITDDGDTALIPAACLAEAYRQMDGENSLLSLLSGIPCVAHAPLTPEQAAEVGAISAKGGGVDSGHAIVETLAADAQLVTTEAAKMRGLLPRGWPVLEV